ncbi:Ribonuclease H superfamily [Sesbania bispinosa]|nr:Ribonuclease H superfamily [Sesbania bispinosa]
MVWDSPQDWLKWLSSAEWWYNTTFHTATGHTSYEILYGQPPPIHLPYIPQECLVDAVDRSFIARELMLQKIKIHLKKATHRMKQQADKHGSERKFKVGDWVLLKLQPYRQHSAHLRRAEKLAPRYFGPYQILHRVGQVANTLKLPDHCKFHPTFHVSLLKHCKNPDIPLRQLPNEWGHLNTPREPLKILDRRIVQRYNRAVTQVLIQWHGELEEETTWETWFHIQQKYPDFAAAQTLEDKGAFDGEGIVRN